jgi:predicted nucleic acid-binding protein
VIPYLLDTNVVVRLMEPSAPEHVTVADAVRRLVRDGHLLALAPQILTELWVVATRPADANGFGWSTTKTAEVIAHLRARFAVLDDGPAAFERWLDLVRAGEVRGKRAHDARIAAVMLSHDISHVLTLNTSDFEGLPGITAIHPAAVIAG